MDTRSELIEMEVMRDHRICCAPAIRNSALTGWFARSKLGRLIFRARNSGPEI
jgi:hypothetical protein